MNSKEQIKIIMVKEGLTAKKLAEILVQKTGKHYTQQSILHKISLSSFRYDEVKIIADLFGYEINISKKQ
jgi:hypothetical protein